MHNEDDPSESSPASEPSTSSQAAASACATSSPVSVPTDAEAPPPPYASVALGATAAPERAFPGDFPVPPPYSVATSLPTYDEVEKAKAAELAASAVDVAPRVRRPERKPTSQTNTSSPRYVQRSAARSEICSVEGS
ncbi:hypothetical protein NFI96_008085 [Prochilodus magdalenae]|nr:hypothetical protein NFI96_008085 [Prochilodus magdalenae]